MKRIIILLMLTLCVGCPFPKTEPKPVEIDGLGSLSSLSNKEIKPYELAEIIRSTTKEKTVNEADARTMLEIYRRNTDEFYNSSLRSALNDKQLGALEIKDYLTLMLRHENLRGEVQAITFDKAENLIKNRIEFANENSAAIGNNAGVLIQVFTNAYKNVIDDDESIRKKLNDINARKKVILLFAFETAASEKVNNQTLTKEEKEKAAKFLSNLREFNEQLPETEKILDANGRLINAVNATPDQLENFQNAVSGGSNSRMKDQIKARQLAEEMQKVMGETANRMGIDPK